MQLLKPAVEWELAGSVAKMAHDGRRIEVFGGGSRAGVGRIPEADARLELTYLRGITRLEPSEHMVTAMAGTPLRDLENELARKGLMLPFEPVDLGPMLGQQPYAATLGGTFGTNLCGSRRVVGGNACDSLSGATMVTGHGELLTLGGAQPHVTRRPDMLRTLCGSWGTLGVMTQLSLRVTALPEETASVLVFDLPNEAAVGAMSEALSSQCGVTGALWLDEALAARTPIGSWSRQGVSLTLLRLESPSSLVPQRLSRLREVLRAYGRSEVLPDGESLRVWGALQAMVPFQGSDGPVWRIQLQPAHAPEFLRGVARYFPFQAMLDWGGALIWLEAPRSSDAGSADIRRVLANLGGHATLIRADEDVRRVVDCFEPVAFAHQPTIARLKSVFDPAGVFNFGRLYEGV